MNSLQENRFTPNTDKTVVDNIIYYSFPKGAGTNNRNNIPFLINSTHEQVGNNKAIYKTHKIDEELLLTTMLQSECHESGIANGSERYFKEMLDHDKLTALNCIFRIFWKHVNSNESAQLNVAIGILHILSHFDYDHVFPTAQVIACTALDHKNVEVCDFALKCFDNWSNKDCVDHLKAVKFHSRWLQQYADEIVAAIESR